MKGFWQAVVILGGTISFLGAQEPGKTFVWNAPKVVTSVFTQNLGMLDSEREEYATNLATIASNGVATAKASPASLTNARRMLALALQLSPRNKRAVVVNFQLAKGILPEVTDSNYSPQVFARLILTRGLLLAKQEGGESAMMARYFIQLAAELDPKNEDAVYASEVQRLDHGTLDWTPVTDAEEKRE